MSGKTISNLSVGLFGDVSHFTHAFGVEAKGSVHSWATSMKDAVSIASKFGGIAAELGVAVAATAFLIKGFKAEAQFEKATVSLGAMLGNMTQAREMMEDLRTLSVNSPLEFGDLTGSARQLSAFGISADQVLPTVKMLGDLAAGSGESVQELTQLYIRAREEGQLSGRELREFTNAGIPLSEGLAKSLGKTPEQIRNLLEAGSVTFPQLQKALVTLTSTGGQFNDMLGKQSRTLSGEWTRIVKGIEDIPAKFVEGLGEDSRIEQVMEDLNEGIGAVANMAKMIGTALGVAIDYLDVGLHELKGWADQFSIVKQAVQFIAEAAGKPLTFPAPKIDPLKPMALSVTPHIHGHELIKWGSAEMLRLQQEWAGEFPRKVNQAFAKVKPPAAGRSAEFNGQTAASLDALKNGFLAAKAGRFGDLIKHLTGGHFVNPLAGHRRDLPDIVAAKNSTTFDILDTESYVGPDGKRHEYSKDHPKTFRNGNYQDILTKDNIRDYLLSLDVPHPANGIKTDDGQYHYQGVYRQNKNLGDKSPGHHASSGFTPKQASDAVQYLQWMYQNSRPENNMTANF